MNQNRFLHMLLQQGSGFLSGEAAAEKLGVSRTAVWKAVKALREAGFEIEGNTNKGYVLKKPCRVLHTALIETALTPFAQSVSGGKIEVLPSIDSTNNEAKRRLSALGGDERMHGSVILAETQTSGRGRFSGRTFYSPPKSGIYLTLTFTPSAAAGVCKGQPPLPKLFTVLAAAAVCSSFAGFGIDSEIKWVNDIFVNGKKVCGILSEGILNMEQKNIEAVAVGVGINVFESADGFPDELKKKAGTLSAVYGKKNAPFLDRNLLAASVISNLLEAFYGTAAKEDLLREYRTRSMVIGKKIRVLPFGGEPYYAKVFAITDEGHLVVDSLEFGRKELFAGEVSLEL